MRRFTDGFGKMICVLTALIIAPGGGAAFGKSRAKNVILMISDGCGYNHIDAASIYQHGKTGDQVYDRFDVKLAMSTYMDGQSYDPMKAWNDFKYVSKSNSYTDSAAAATAMSTGVKTYNGAIGVDPDKAPLKHTVQIAEQLGKATGVVTTVQISHGTPAGFVAHNKNRNNYEEIAGEMIYESGLEVIMGCGHPEYDNDGKPAGIKKEYKYVGGKSVWEDLKDGSVTGADADGDGVPDRWTVIHEPAEFRKLASGDTPKRVIAIAKKLKTLQQERGGKDKADPFEVPFNGDVPTLAEMTGGALNVLDNDPDGFFLMIEGGAIDWASHDNQAGRVIEEQIEFNKAVEAVAAWVEAESSWNDTLLIITGDHETGYLTGPDSGAKGGKPVWNPVAGRGKGRTPKMEYHSDSHTNSLIPFYAHGVGSQLYTSLARKTDPVRGPYLDNTSIPKVIFTLFGY